MNDYDPDDEYNTYSLMLVPYFTDTKELNIKIGMAFPFVEDEDDETHVQMVGALTLLATAFKQMQEDEKFAKKLIKRCKETLSEFQAEYGDVPATKIKTYLDEDKKVVKTSFRDTKK